jgi:hypothetical protein
LARFTQQLGGQCTNFSATTAPFADAATAARVSSGLPWGWWAGLAAVATLLTSMHCRRRSRRAARQAQIAACVTLRRAQLKTVELQGKVLCNGWWIPISRAVTFRPSRAT